VLNEYDKCTLLLIQVGTGGYIDIIHHILNVISWMSCWGWLASQEAIR
jgi:hypothetical protein